MSIEKSLYAMPAGLEQLEAEPDIEIEIEDPESVEISMDGLEIEIGKEPMTGEDFDANLAEFMDEKELAMLAGDLIGEFEEDLNSRKDWMQTYVDGLELLGMKIEERMDPWAGACGVYHPLLSEALVKFQSETVMAILPAAGPVKTQIIGKETPEKKDSAVRVQNDMNYQIMDKMTEFRPETERMLWGLGLSGNAFKKVYFDPALNRQTSVFVPAEDLVVPYGAANLQTAPRVTHVMRKTANEMKRLQVSGFYRDVDLGDPDTYLDEVEKKIAERMGFNATSDDRFKLLEMQVDLDLPGYEDEDGIALPYIVTIEKSNGTVLAIRRNWRPEDETKQKRNHFVHYGYVPGFGFYCFGLIHLVGAFAKSGTSLIRQLVDAGTLSNLPGGFKTRGLRVKGDDTPISPAEFRDVDVPSGTIKDNIMTLPYKEPSQVLYSLLNTIVDEGRRFASAADLKVSDMSANAPVGTTLALLERQLKTMSAVQARIHYSFKQELQLIRDIIRDCTPPDYPYEPEEGSPMTKQSDYDDVDVIPVSDPNASTMSQKVVQYQAALQLAQGAPQLYDLPLLHRQMLDVLGIKDAAKLVPLPEDQKPEDPVTENMGALKGKPLKAFMYQDHDAHIAIHMNLLQDPKLAQTMGQNPMAQQLQSAIMAHIADHLGYKYRKDIEMQMGVPLPAPGEQLPEDAEVQLSQLVAQASNQLLQQNKTQAAQEQAQQLAQDPVVQMQQKEIAIKEQDVIRKAEKDKADAMLKARQQDIEKERIAAQERQAQNSLAAKITKDMADVKAENERTQVQALQSFRNKPKG
jgi:hypothetical protein